MSVGALGLAGAVTIVGVSMLVLGVRPTVANEGDELSVAPPAAGQTVGGVKGARKKVERNRGASRERSKAAKRQERRAAAATPVEVARLLLWRSVAKAVYYEVAFVRDGTRVHRVRTRVARLRLPKSVGRTPGKYAWVVRPAVRRDGGIKLRAPIVESSFTVPR